MSPVTQYILCVCPQFDIRICCHAHIFLCCIYRIAVTFHTNALFISCLGLFQMVMLGGLYHSVFNSWRRNDMEILSALLSLWYGCGDLLLSLLLSLKTWNKNVSCHLFEKPWRSRDVIVISFSLMINVYTTHFTNVWSPPIGHGNVVLHLDWYIVRVSDSTQRGLMFICTHIEPIGVW